MGIYKGQEVRQEEPAEIRSKRPFGRTWGWLLGLSLILNVAMGLYLVWRPNTAPSEKPGAAMTTPSPKPKKKAPAERYSSILGYDKIPPSFKLRRTAILNTLVERYGYTSYLEIGQGFRRDNFDWVRCPVKIGVDPDKSLNAAYQMTSDEFFVLNDDTFDLIFIDGLHQADQVERDILNALKILNENGAILVHDCNPTTQAMQVVPRSQAFWTGDVWKAWVKLRATRPDLKMYVINTDAGCGLIRKGSQETIQIPASLTYEGLAENRQRWLNLVEPNDFLADLKRDRS
jgi:hypothetical protein